jgi:signal transduction histidine kinase
MWSGRPYIAAAVAGMLVVVLIVLALGFVRVRRALALRTRTFAAICHDLRTPLTRLRLHSERASVELSGGMLREIDRIDRMLQEALNYVTHDIRLKPERIDLPSLLRTICSEFTDVGYTVTYEGPARMTLLCRSSALARAITNLVDNATKHCTAVQVRLCERKDTVDVEICDDGPGIPESLRAKVFDPFFKASEGQRLQGERSFGLGLSIAQDIARSHRGQITLHDRAPHGLAVRVSLPKRLVIRAH